MGLLPSSKVDGHIQSHYGERGILYSYVLQSDWQGQGLSKKKYTPKHQCLYGKWWRIAEGHPVVGQAQWQLVGFLFPRHDAPMHQISWVGKRYPRVTARAWLIVWIWVDYTPTLSVGSSSISPGYPICDFKWWDPPDLYPCVEEIHRNQKPIDIHRNL